MRGFEVVRHSCMDLNPHLTRVAFDYLAEKLATTGVEALVIDTVHFFIELIPWKRVRQCGRDFESILIKPALPKQARQHRAAQLQLGRNVTHRSALMRARS